MDNQSGPLIGCGSFRMICVSRTENRSFSSHFLFHGWSLCKRIVFLWKSFFLFFGRMWGEGESHHCKELEIKRLGEVVCTRSRNVCVKCSRKVITFAFVSIAFAWYIHHIILDKIRVPFRYPSNWNQFKLNSIEAHLYHWTS